MKFSEFPDHVSRDYVYGVHSTVDVHSHYNVFVPYVEMSWRDRITQEQGQRIFVVYTVCVPYTVLSGTVHTKHTVSLYVRVALLNLHTDLSKQSAKTPFTSLMKAVRKIPPHLCQLGSVELK